MTTLREFHKRMILEAERTGSWGNRLREIQTWRFWEARSCNPRDERHYTEGFMDGFAVRQKNGWQRIE